MLHASTVTQSVPLRGMIAHVKGSSQYSENIVATMLRTMPSLVSSVPVVSIRMLRVLSVILLCSLLMIGGIDATVRVES